MSSSSAIEKPKTVSDQYLVPATRPRESRLAAPDSLRGLVMVLMALDHANYFVARKHTGGEFWFASFLPRYDSDLAFITRLVTHLAAPGFFFLMGAGMAMFVSSRRSAGWTEGAIMRHLALRGAILILLQLLVENRAWPLASSPDTGADFWIRYFGVLYGLGGAMVLSVPMMKLPSAAVTSLGLLAIIATQALLPSRAEAFNMHPVRVLLLTAGVSDAVNVFYPIVPWLGIAGLGIVFGRWLLRDERQAYVGALWIGAACLAVFVLTRSTVGFTDMHPPDGPGWIAFLNVTKYPPSISFTLLTLGANLVLLYALSVTTRRLTSGVGARLIALLLLRPLLVFGQSPLFFYLTHLFLYACIGLIVAPQGMELAQMYPFWLLGLAILYPLCLWYGRFKQRQPADSPWRFL